MNAIPLNVAAQVKLDASGNGSTSVGPTGFKVTWHGITASVHCSTNVSEATCRIYVGSAADPQFFADGTYAGSTGDSTDNLPPQVTTGQQVFAVWSGGDAGATGYLTVTGTQEVA